MIWKDPIPVIERYNEPDPDPIPDSPDPTIEDAVDGAMKLGSFRAAPNAIESPQHYTHSKIEAWDYIEDSLGAKGASYYHEGTAKKYLHRWRHKGRIEDLEKAVAVIKRLITLVKDNKDATSF